MVSVIVGSQLVSRKHFSGQPLTSSHGPLSNISIVSIPDKTSGYDIEQNCAGANAVSVWPPHSR